jgi:hypothetical protein
LTFRCYCSWLLLAWLCWCFCRSWCQLDAKILNMFDVEVCWAPFLLIWLQYLQTEPSSTQKSFPTLMALWRSWHFIWKCWWC